MAQRVRKHLRKKEKEDGFQWIETINDEKRFIIY